VRVVLAIIVFTHKNKMADDTATECPPPKLDGEYAPGKRVRIYVLLIGSNGGIEFREDEVDRTFGDDPQILSEVQRLIRECSASDASDGSDVGANGVGKSITVGRLAMVLPMLGMLAGLTKILSSSPVIHVASPSYTPETRKWSKHACNEKTADEMWKRDKLARKQQVAQHKFNKNDRRRY
jgi:hypothetical protein